MKIKPTDVTQNIESLLSAIDSQHPLSILDFGCGPGRDLMDFTKRGHLATGLDGCANFVSMAELNSKSEVLHEDFINLSLPLNKFDGIFANASLFHVPSSELDRVLKDLASTLKEGGILFSSNPRGSGEGWNGDRWGHYMELDVYEKYLNNAGHNHPSISNSLK